jgi:hypothetical protein
MESNNTCEKCVCSQEGEDLDLERQPLDMNILVNEPLNVEIPIFDPTINLNEELDLNLDLEKVMTDIEHTANFNSVEEGLNALNNPDTIFTRLQNAFNTFKEAVGRQMTYSEMRQMMG